MATATAGKGRENSRKRRLAVTIAVVNITARMTIPAQVCVSATPSNTLTNASWPAPRATAMITLVAMGTRAQRSTTTVTASRSTTLTATPMGFTC